MPERQRLTEMGACATSRYRLKRKRGVAFGRCVSAARAANAAAFAKTQRQRLALMPIDAQLERIGKSAIGAGSAVVASSMKQARALVRAEAAGQRLELAAVETRLRAYNARTAAEGIQGIASAAPLPPREMFVATPTPHGDVFQLRHIFPREWCSTALAWCARHPRASRVGSSLESTWAASHALIRPEECTPVAAPAPPSRCQLAGRCLCAGDGRRLYLMAEAVLAALKRTFKRDALAMRLLREAHVAIHLRGVNEGLGARGDLYFHIGLMYLNPFRPTFHALALAADLGEAPLDDRRVYFKARLGPNAARAASWIRWKRVCTPLTAWVLSKRGVVVLSMQGGADSGGSGESRRVNATQRVFVLAPDYLQPPPTPHATLVRPRMRTRHYTMRSSRCLLFPSGMRHGTSSRFPSGCSRPWTPASFRLCH